MEKHKHVWIDVHGNGSWFLCSVCDAETNSPAGMDWLAEQIEKWEKSHPELVELEEKKDAENQTNLQS